MTDHALLHGGHHSYKHVWKTFKVFQRPLLEQTCGECGSQRKQNTRFHQAQPQGLYKTSQSSQLHHPHPSSPWVCLNSVGSQHPIQHTDPWTNPEEGCQVRDEWLHDEDSWLRDSHARRSGMGHIAEQTARQQALHSIQDRPAVSGREEGDLLTKWRQYWVEP